VITSGSVITGAKVTEHEVKIELDADVLFDFDKYNLRPEAEYAQDT
jgi:outer membrane protein OmpA-like peptidoglycan-associated protein